MAAQHGRCCYLCKFHDVYWDGHEFAGCECRAWDNPEMLEKHHVCGRASSAEAARTSGTRCPRFLFYPPEDVTD